MRVENAPAACRVADRQHSYLLCAVCGLALRLKRGVSPLYSPSTFLGRLFDIQRKFLTGMQLVRMFTSNEWRFRTEGMADLASRLSPADRESFYFDPANYTWPEYFERCVLGVREHYHKETLDTLPRAAKELRM